MAGILLALDESGKLDNTEDVVFGGCMSENGESHRFGEKWNARLDESKIDSLHMRDAMRLGGDFRGWKDSDRDDYCANSRHWPHGAIPIPMLVAAPMTSTEFRAMPQANQKQLKILCYLRFRGLCTGGREFHPQGEPHSLQIVCDLSEEYSIEVLRLFHRLRRRNEEIKRRCHALFFADDRYIPVLQLADMFAYVCRAFHSGNPPEVVLDIIEIITGNRTIEADSRMVYEAARSTLVRVFFRCQANQQSFRACGVPTVSRPIRARAASSSGASLSTYQAWAILSIPAPTRGVTVRRHARSATPLVIPPCRTRLR